MYRLSSSNGHASNGLTYRPSIIWTYVLALIVQSYVPASHHSDLCIGRPSFGLSYQPSLFGLMYQLSIIWTYIPAPHHSDLHTNPSSFRLMYRPRESIPYLMLYQFSQWCDIFRIPVNTSIPFRVYRKIIYIYIYIYIFITFKINKFSILLIMFLLVHFFVITNILIKLISYKQ